MDWLSGLGGVGSVFAVFTPSDLSLSAKEDMSNILSLLTVIHLREILKVR